MNVAGRVRQYILDELEIETTERDHSRSVADIILSSTVHEDEQILFIENFIRDFDIVEYTDGKRIGKFEMCLGRFKNKFSFDLDSMRVSDLIEMATKRRIDH